MSGPAPGRVSSTVREMPASPVSGRVVGGVVLPAMPEHEQPCSGRDPHGVAVVVASGAGATVEITDTRMEHQ